MTFAYTPENLATLLRTISPERLGPYLADSGNDLEAAIRLYELNGRLSAIFYGPLQGLEIVVRNAIDDQLRASFGEGWTDLQTIKLQPIQQAMVNAAIKEAGNQDGGEGELTHGEIIAELKFGFWVGILGPKNDIEVWRKALWKAFPHRPKGIERKVVQAALNSIRRLRNRVAHHRRILHRNLTADHATMLEIAGWVCPATRDWIAALSTFDAAELPVPQDGLPFDGISVIDPIPPTSSRETKDGRKLLSIKPNSAG